MKRGANERDRPAAASSSQGAADDADSAVESMLRKAARLSDVPLTPPLPRLGQIIGNKYRIDERLGRGGMGAVFRATHLVSLKPVALKWMLRSTADAAAHQRLLREALAAGRIDHPNVVDVYDVGEEAQGAYLVMELLHGESLRARLARGPLDCAALLDLLLPAMLGVSAAHRAGVIHRDLKPDNIFLCTGPDGSAREAKVLDFGVSAVLARNTLSPTLTDGATILGTPAYMSPEQLASALDLDERTDVYAFGVILYEGLTGRLPFVADSYSGYVLAVAHDEPRPLTELRPDIPGGLERVVFAALSKRRQDRPHSVEALMHMLVPFAPGRLVPATQPRPASRAWRTPSWLPVAAACALALALLLRAGYALLLEDDAAAASSPSNTPVHARNDEAAALGGALPRAYSQPPPPSASDAPPRLAPVALGTSERAPAGLTPPRTCEGARLAGQSVDGIVTIDPDGSGPLRAFKVFCAGMSVADAAREYLPLPAATRANADNNTRFRYGGSACPCPDLVRRFSHVRLDPTSLVVDPSDGTFATYDRPLQCEDQHRSQCGESTNLAWGGAGSCRGSGDTSGSASIDLRGTPFVLARGAKFVPAGFGAAGRVLISRDRRTAKLTGGGLCGALVPEQGGVPLEAAR